MEHVGDSMQRVTFFEVDFALAKWGKVPKEYSTFIVWMAMSHLVRKLQQSNPYLPQNRPPAVFDNRDITTKNNQQ